MAAVTAYEYYAYFVYDLVPLSVQEIIDCVTVSNGFTSKGCNNGTSYEALQYISVKGRIHSNATYTYIAAVSSKFVKQIFNIIW